MTSWLVTGGAGYIGAHVVKALRDRDEAVVVIDDFSTGDASNLADLRSHPRFDLAHVDVVHGLPAQRASVTRIFCQPLIFLRAV